MVHPASPVRGASAQTLTRRPPERDGRTVPVAVAGRVKVGLPSFSEELELRLGFEHTAAGLKINRLDAVIAHLEWVSGWDRVDDLRGALFIVKGNLDPDVLKRVR